MQATQLRRKFEAINRAIETQIEKLESLIEDFEDPQAQELLEEYAEKLSALVITDEDSDTSAASILDYFDNELIPNESDYNSEEEEE